jgi:hypothetical protein
MIRPSLTWPVCLVLAEAEVYLPSDLTLIFTRSEIALTQLRMGQVRSSIKSDLVLYVDIVTKRHTKVQVLLSIVRKSKLQLRELVTYTRERKQEAAERVTERCDCSDRVCKGHVQPKSYRCANHPGQINDKSGCYKGRISIVRFLPSLSKHAPSYTVSDCRRTITRSTHLFLLFEDSIQTSP